MGRFLEPLNMGLWTAEDPALLEKGQLQDIRNAVYLPGSQSLQRAPGRDVFGTVSATAVDVMGLRDVQFDNGDQYLFALASNKIRRAPIGDTGSFSDLLTLGATGAQLEAVQYQNRFFLFSGVPASASGIGSNQVIYLSGTGVGTTPSVRQHGMVPVRMATVTATSAATFSQTVTGYYEYWTTEVARYVQDGATAFIESTFEGSPATVQVTSTTISPVLTMPQIANSGFTTHWRIYRSPKKDLATDVKFPTGFMIAEVSTATAQVTDTVTSSNSGFLFPTTYNTGGQPHAGFTNPSNLGADDASYASGVMGASSLVSQAAYGFAFSGVSGPIVGIEVEIQGYIQSGVSPVVASVYCGTRDAGTGSVFVPGIGGDVEAFGTGSQVYAWAAKSFTITSTSSASPTTVTLGGATDRWINSNFVGFRDSDFDSTFAVVIVLPAGSKTLGFDYVKTKVYYGATITASTVQFPTVVYNFGDIQAQVGKNGQPPSGTTGDVYEGQLVTDDISNPSLIRFSAPGSPEAFPSTYFVDYETRENDRVRAIRVVNDRLIVWLDSSTWRQNYLPSERDSSFDRGKSKATISSTYGCLNPMCVAVYSPGGDADVAAFVSHHGIHGTDGFQLSTYTDGLDWDRLFPSSSTAIALVNDRRRNILLFYFTNSANYGAETVLCMPMAYGEGHWADNRPKICGLIHMRNQSGADTAEPKSAWCAQRSNGTVSTYIGYGGSNAGQGAGKVYIETGTTIPALDPLLRWTTRRIYPAEFTEEFTLGELYGHAHGYATSTPVVSYSVSGSKTNDTGHVALGTKSITLGGQTLHKTGPWRVASEGIEIAASVTASAYAADCLILDVGDLGLEDSGR